MTLDLNLHKRLKEQFTQESATIQTATQQQLSVMRSELKHIYSDALTTIEADMNNQAKALARRFRHLMMLPSLILIVISLAISAAAWGFTQYQRQQIQESRQTLNNLATLGVEPVRQSDGREFLLLPEGATVGELRQTTDGQPFIELMR